MHIINTPYLHRERHTLNVHATTTHTQAQAQHIHTQEHVTVQLSSKITSARIPDTSYMRSGGVPHMFCTHPPSGEKGCGSNVSLAAAA